MLEFTKDLLLHFFIMMIIPLVLNLFSRQNKSLSTQIGFIIIIIITLFLTMLFPVQLSNEVLFDLKFIPIFIAFFYGGRMIGLLSIFTLIITNIILGEVNILLVIINYGIISILFLSLMRWYQNFSLSKKIIVAFLSYLGISITRFFVLAQTSSGDIYYLLLFSIVSFLTLAFSIYLIEINQRELYMMKKLQDAEKLNSISQLAASVAHEIRNPMTTIRGFMQLLKNEQNLTEEQNLFVSISLEELSRTQTIIDDFLSLARPNSRENRLINISLTLKEACDFMRPYAVISNIEICPAILENLFIKGSQQEFKQLIINLIKNGIEAMPNGGKLAVSGFAGANDEVVVSIKDHGVGISQSQLKRLGQPYYSTKTRGTGLGLMISFDIIKRMQGKIEIESKEQVGTVITLLFPKMLP